MCSWYLSHVADLAGGTGGKSNPDEPMRILRDVQRIVMAPDLILCRKRKGPGRMAMHRVGGSTGQHRLIFTPAASI